MSLDGEKVFLGFDFSTQQLKSVVINSKREVLHEAHVLFDNDLPEFRTHNGVVKGDKKAVTTPVLMWVKALDMILEKLRVCGADFSKVCAVSGSAQQHGTVYWSCGAGEVLKNLDDSHFLHTQLASSFSVTSSPIWMDGSTKKQCVTLEKAIGGPIELAKLTGSKAYERYSAAQIAKIAETKSTAYKNTERITLVSNFACSLLLGRYAPIDYSDGSGMNLLDLSTKQWSPACMQATAVDLEEKLGEPVPTNTPLGKISKYFVERFGFNEDCKVIAFTGDNPSSLAGMCLNDGDLAVSLGTSDTIFMWLKEPVPLAEGHILINPVKPDEYMGLLCYKNGSTTRDRLRKIYANSCWEEFNSLLDSTPRGNFGYMGLYFDFEEIMLPLQGDFRFDKAGNDIDKFPSPEIEIRALVEGQFLAKRAQLEDLNIHIGENTRIIATGGGSKNRSILQVMSDVFSSPVYTLDYTNIAALGAAYRALDFSKSVEEREEKTEQTTSQLTLCCKPFTDSKELYDPMVVRYRTNISKLLSKQTE
ncbi:xylulose kinase [Cimex lectularius]|uniref:Xylulose kinase n=1 Tax=Cimex lectularius TaxID=79782 RepID=A0A8I6TD56_CIMLE|nr:xylulose kinase [Cimex lectularius]XP_014245572.1 xylulose kinase [Cimex lectularius]XP_014245573.1 xylulose kinase [Cimex lectularius]